MAFEWMSGCELGSLGGVGNDLGGTGYALMTAPSPRTGTYFLRCASTSGTGSSSYGGPLAPGGTNSGASWGLPFSIRFAFRPILLPPSGFEQISAVGGYSLNINSNGTLAVSAGGAGGGAVLGTGTTVLALNTWYVIEMTVGVASTGVVRLRVYPDISPAGADEFASFTSVATSGGWTIGTFGFGGIRFNAAPVTFDYDDMHVKEGTNAYLGNGKIILLRNVDGPPYGTYTDYVPGSLIGGGSIFSVWNNLPFNNTTYAGNASALLQRQTIFHAHSGLPAGTTINAIGLSQLAAVDSGSISFYNLYRVGGVDWIGSSGSLFHNTWVLWYDVYGGTLPTVAQLDASEIGVRADAGRTGGLQYYTADIFLQVDYMPPVATVAGKIQARRKR